MPDSTAVEDWLRVHRDLLQLESEFTDLALRAAAGEVTIDELDHRRLLLLATRELCAVIYDRAFGNPKAR